MKNLILTLFALFTILQIQAQTFSIGPRVGFNMASLSHFSEQEKYTEKYIQNGQLLSFHAGAVANIAFTRNLSIQGEFLFSKKGHRLNYLEDTVNFSVDGYEKYLLNYLELPVLLKLSFGPDEVKGFINAGTYWGKWLGGVTRTKIDYVTDGEESTIDESIDIDFDADYEGLDYKANINDFGLVFGGGFMYETGPGSLLIDFRYTISLRDINKWEDKSLQPVDYKEFNNKVFSISFGYLFSF